MRIVTIECLACGATRDVLFDPRHVDSGECPRCGYVGWAPSSELTERVRRLLRERSLDARDRLKLVA